MKSPLDTDFYLLGKTLISFSCRFPVLHHSWGSSAGSGVVFTRVLKGSAVRDLQKKKNKNISLSGCSCMSLITWPLESNLD